MKSVDAWRVRELAAAFRAAIVRCEPRKLPFGLREFPAGACGDASLLLAQFLEDLGFRGATYVAGLRDRYTHAWLELEDLIVDITVDQFAADPEALLMLDGIPKTADGIVVTRNRNWHSMFEETRRSAARIEIYDEATTRTLADAYREIRAQL